MNTAQVPQFTSATRIRRVLGLSYPACKKLCEGVESFRVSPKILQVSIAGIEAKIGPAAAAAIRNDMDNQRMLKPREWRSKEVVPHPHQPDSK